MARSPLKGRARVNRLLRRLPDAVRGELVVEFYVSGRQIHNAVEAKAPHRRGKLRRALSFRVLPKSLRLQVGLLGTPRGRADVFYGRIQDLGRTAQIVRVTRRAKGRGAVRPSGKPLMRRSRGKATRGQLRQVGTPYSMAVPAMAPKRFVTGRYPDLRATLRTNLNGIMARSLGKIAGGAE